MQHARCWGRVSTGTTHRCRHRPVNAFHIQPLLPAAFGSEHAKAGLATGEQPRARVRLRPAMILDRCRCEGPGKSCRRTPVAAAQVPRQHPHVPHPDSQECSHVIPSGPEAMAPARIRKQKFLGGTVNGMTHCTTNKHMGGNTNEVLVTTKRLARSCSTPTAEPSFGRTHHYGQQGTTV